MEGLEKILSTGDPQFRKLVKQMVELEDQRDGTASDVATQTGIAEQMAATREAIYELDKIRFRHRYPASELDSATLWAYRSNLTG